jgi:hypothetical protein
MLGNTQHKVFSGHDQHKKAKEFQTENSVVTGQKDKQEVVFNHYLQHIGTTQGMSSEF